MLDLHGETMGTSWSVRFAAPAGTDPSSIRARDRRAAGRARRGDEPLGAGLAAVPLQPVAGRHLDDAATRLRACHDARPRDRRDDRRRVRSGDRPARRCLGFRPRPRRLRRPSAAEIETARATSGWPRLSFAPAGAHLRQPGGIALDLSGIAKGHAVDAVADLLHDAGIANALVEIGGELVGRGIRPDGDPWWVDLESPPGLTLAPLRIALHGLAVATSGDYRRGAHTLDPRTGRPIDTGVVSASVIHETALDADAWATALTVLGPDGLDACATITASPPASSPKSTAPPANT